MQAALGATVEEVFTRAMRAERYRLTLGSYRAYWATYRARVGPLIGERDIRQLTPADFEDVAAQSDGMRSASRVRVILKRIARRARAEMLVDFDLTSSLGPLRRKPRQRPNRVIENVAEVIAAALEEDRWYGSFFEFLAATGLRPGEAAVLMWEDWRGAEGKLWVRRTFSSGQVRDRTKTGTERELLLPPAARRSIERMRDLQMETWDEMAEWIFASPEHKPPGRPLGLRHATRRWHALLSRLGRPAHRLYDLRHTYASFLAAKTADVALVARRLGHSSPAVTLRVYVDQFNFGGNHEETLCPIGDGSPALVDAGLADRARGDALQVLRKVG
jgi:integrase